MHLLVIIFRLPLALAIALIYAYDRIVDDRGGGVAIVESGCVDDWS